MTSNQYRAWSGSAIARARWFRASRIIAKAPTMTVGLMHWELGGYRPATSRSSRPSTSTRARSARDVAEAIFATPNCTTVFCDRRAADRRHGAHGPRARRRRRAHGATTPTTARFVRRRRARGRPRPRSSRALRETRRRGAAQLPAGRLRGGDALLRRVRARGRRARWSTASRCSSPATRTGRERFARSRAADRRRRHQGAARRHHRRTAMLTDLFRKRGVKLDRTYQLNTGGNTDFLNMLNRDAARRRRRSRRPRRCSRSPPSGSTTTTSTSARATTCRGRTTTRSASCAWRAGCSATCR